MTEQGVCVKCERLWQLLDDIDTLDDACKDDDARFRRRVYSIQQKRHALYKSDGYTLSNPDGPVRVEVHRGPKYTVLQFGEVGTRIIPETDAGTPEELADAINAAIEAAYERGFHRSEEEIRTKQKVARNRMLDEVIELSLRGKRCGWLFDKFMSELEQLKERDTDAIG